MGKKLPKKYRKGIPRVSDIVSFAFPFEGTEGEARFHGWLASKGVSHKKFMDLSSRGGTAVHKALEDYCKTGKVPKKSKYMPWIAGGIKFVNECGYEEIHNEIHVRHKAKFQGTCDAVIKATFGGHIMIDWKSYGLAKKLLGVGSSSYSVPYDKLKKASIQLSLYAYALKPTVKIRQAFVIELTGDGKYVSHELELWDDVAIEALIKRYHQWLKR